MIGKLNELGMSKFRHELQLMVNTSEAVPIRGMPADIVHKIEKRVGGGLLGKNKETSVTEFTLDKDTFEPGE